MNLRGIANTVRYNTWFSHALVLVARPLQKASEWASSQIKKKAWLNGGSVEYDGVRLNFPKNVGVSYTSLIFWNGVEGYEPDTWRAMRPLLENAKQFADIGSNIGLYAVLARKVNPALRVDAFEPIPSIFLKNRKFHLANGLDTTNIRQVAVSDADGFANIALPRWHDAMEEQLTATLRPDSWQMHAGDSTYIQVPTQRLDTFFTENPVLTPLVMKIDVEDFESSVLRGGETLLTTARPWIVCEPLPRPHHNQQTAEFLLQMDYALFGICREGLFRFRIADFGMPRRFTDFVLIPRECVSNGKNYLALQEFGALYRKSNDARHDSDPILSA